MDSYTPLQHQVPFTQQIFVDRLLHCLDPSVLGPGMLVRGGKGMKTGNTHRHTDREARSRQSSQHPRTSACFYSKAQGDELRVSAGEQSQAINFGRHRLQLLVFIHTDQSFIDTWAPGESFVIFLEPSPCG